MQKKIVVMIFIFALGITRSTSLLHAQTINEADTELCETVKYALINSLREPIDKAINEIYKNDPNAPSDLTWASYDTEMLKIKQLYGVGGEYEITFKITPYYHAHITYGEDIIVVSTDGKVIDYTHVKTYPKEPIEK